MDMTQTLNAQLAMMMFFTLIPMLGMMQARNDRRHQDRLSNTFERAQESGREAAGFR